jgi:hypothetical protein
MAVRKIIRNALGIIGLAAALPLLAMPAQANAAQSCTAGAGHSCIRVINKTGAVHSLRINPSWGTCLTGSTPGATTVWRTVTVSSNTSAPLNTYTGTGCQGGTQNSVHVFWNTTPDASNYETVTISDSQTCDCTGCSPSSATQDVRTDAVVRQGMRTEVYGSGRTPNCIT